MSGLRRAKKTKKNRKHGRNAAFCLRYKNEDRESKNKVKKLVKHLAKFENDRCAVHCLANLKRILA